MIQTRREVTKTSRLPRERSLGREQESGRVGEISNMYLSCNTVGGEKCVCYFTESPRQAGNLQPTLTDHVNIGPDPPKMFSYWPVGSSGNTALKLL